MKSRKEMTMCLQLKFLEKSNRPIEKMCYTMNFYHDCIKTKTLLFCGFSDSNLKIYDLKSDSWLPQQFETQDFVTSIHFLFKKKKPQNLVFYTQANKNKVIFADINSGLIIAQTDLGDTADSIDSCV